MFYFIFKVFVIVVSIEALTELVVKSEFFSPLRNFFSGEKNSKLYNFIDSILQCPYCFSVWSSLIILSMTYNYYTIFILYILSAHRASNVLHNMFDKLQY